MDHLLRAEADLATDEARRIKTTQNKHVGRPIDLGSKVIQLVVREDDAWTAESGGIARRTNLTTGKTSQVYRGHSAPVTSLAFWEIESPSGPTETVLITASWDKSIKVWNTKTKVLISETVAHADFVKNLLVIPELQVLVSSSSDKTVKIWNLAPLSLNAQGALYQLGSISAHTRPVEALTYTYASSDGSIILLTGDSMGVLKAWSLEKTAPIGPNSSGQPTVRCSPKDGPQGHRTGIGHLLFSGHHLWSASADSTVQLQAYPRSPSTSSVYTIQHVRGVNCLLSLLDGAIKQPYLLTASGDSLRLYDISDLLVEDDGKEAILRKGGKEDLVIEVDVHSHRVTGLGLWMEPSETSTSTESCIISSSLDGTLRRWPLKDLIQGRVPAVELDTKEVGSSANNPGVELTEDEERELAELMDD